MGGGSGDLSALQLLTILRVAVQMMLNSPTAIGLGE